jgi:hypothetical protein
MSERFLGKQLLIAAVLADGTGPGGGSCNCLRAPVNRADGLTVPEHISLFGDG